METSTNSNVILTPDALFAAFRRGQVDISQQAIESFRALDEKARGASIEDARLFLQTEKEDHIRSWGTTVLEVIGGERSFKLLMGLMEDATESEKQTYRYTRFFALRALSRIATREDCWHELLPLVRRIRDDRMEQGLTWAGSMIILASQKPPDQEAQASILSRLKDVDKDFWGTYAVLRALQEFPLAEATDYIIAAMKTSKSSELRRRAINALGIPDYGDNIVVIRAIGDMLRNPDANLRLDSVLALKALGNKEAERDLLHVLVDKDAEIREEATRTIEGLLGKAEAIRTIAAQALAQAVQDSQQCPVLLVDALRRIDQERMLTIEVLNKELAGDDRQRAAAAELILLELGGEATIQRLSQRRSTLTSLDAFLEQSEQVVKSNFERTIRQALVNFYFAMAVNVVVVAVGIALVGLAISQLITTPSNLVSWVVPGGAGIFGVIMSQFFNNPRKNAREDLSALMVVNIIYLGFLRQINQIDATFKHAYIERFNFGAEQMQETVDKIEEATSRTLEIASSYLLSSSDKPKVEGGTQDSRTKTEARALSNGTGGPQAGVKDGPPHWTNTSGSKS